MSDRPRYRQLADHLRERIAAGEVKEGRQLPSERELMDRFGASRGTIRQAIGLLRTEGLIEIGHGKGAYVRRRPAVRRLAFDRFSRRRRACGAATHPAEREADGENGGEVEVIRIAQDAADDDVARRLRLQPGDPILVRSHRYLAAGCPSEIATSYIPWGLADGTPLTQENPGPGGIYARIEEAGHELDHFEEEVTGRMPTPEETRALRLTPGIPVLHVVRTAYDREGAAVEVCDAIKAADQHILVYRLPAD